MPRSLKVVIECDQCSEEIESEEHEGALTLSINGKPTKQIDLCSACMRGENDTTPMSLVYIYEEADPIPEPKVKRTSSGTGRNQSEPSPCPACDHVAGSPQGLGRHARTVHGMSVQELRAHRRASGLEDV